jgi:hypothetical protein
MPGGVTGFNWESIGPLKAAAPSQAFIAAFVATFVGSLPTILPKL